MFVEGGSRIHSSFFKEGLAYELYLYRAPRLIGNSASLFMDDMRNVMAVGESLRFLDVRQIGLDIRIHAKFLKED